MTPSKKNQIIKVKAEKIVFPGNVLCRCDDGIALFCENLLPNEEAEVLVIKDKKTFREGKLQNILVKSPLRQEPKCSSFGKCGGCSFQHTDYQNQIEYKTIYVKELLNFIDIDIPQTEQSPVQWNYRNKMEFSFFNDNDILNLGLHCKGSFYRYSQVPPCYIAHEDIVKVVDIVKDFALKSNLKAYHNKSHEGFYRHLVVRKGVNTGDLLINIVTNKIDNIDASFWNDLVNSLSSFSSSIYWTQNSKLSDAVNSDLTTLLYGKENITEKLTVANKTFNFSIAPFSFFQTNTKGTEVLYNKIIESLNPKEDETLLDMYCGTGAIGICVAPHVKNVVAVEQVEDSIISAKYNAAYNNINNIEFFTSTAEDWVKQNKTQFTSVIIDPPRMGLTQSVIDHLLYLNPEKIVYVSCNPSTLARDLKIIIASDKFNITKISAVDMFPQTYHIETIVLLERK
ncbi:MAG: 23S rRNA (uracil(1939)-C(5))-methyltransferase RlmD [Endomicrobiia bacterium]|nr:23S rRNA (uracil(1939)-C(5))-methyltransferase RlmD [Endomicrobiaceae bacterium]MDD3053498.1 23S rRNA (uracil(1939)-C(5))-methyltransferase RlmD [Endomicrobiaceae bacterium]